jgi:hypothetical protein
MAADVTELALGADTQPTRLGLALVTFDDPPRPVWADTFALRRPAMTLGAAVRAAVRRASAEAERADGAVVLVGIERAIVGGPNTSLATCWDSGGVYWLTRDACERVWKGRRLRFEPLRPGEWKVKALGPGHGNDTKDKVAIWARGIAREAGWDDLAMNGLREADATDALGIAVGAVKKARA